MHFCCPSDPSVSAHPHSAIKRSLPSHCLLRELETKFNQCIQVCVYHAEKMQQLLLLGQAAAAQQSRKDYKTVAFSGMGIFKTISCVCLKVV